MTPLTFVLLMGCLYLFIRFLHVTSRCAPPILAYTKSQFNETIIANCPILNEIYFPPLLWGKSGHIQTIVYAKMGRVNTPLPKGERFNILMHDGATVTFDVFEPLKSHPTAGDYTLAMCPGIANSSQSTYIRTCVYYAQQHGFRVAVLNHLGALLDVPLTAPRIFTYGGTEEYASMIDRLHKLYPSTSIIAVGFSMGANIVVKYIGEDVKNQTKVIGAISCCQGYDVLQARPLLLSWEHCRRLYIWAMTAHQKSLLRRHSSVLFGNNEQKPSHKFDLNRIFDSVMMDDLDEHYSRRRAGFDSVEAYYHWVSSANYLHSINIPVLFLNAIDDPIVPPELLDIPKQFALSRDKVIFAATHHGGHLGFFEGGHVYPEEITWLDRIVIQYANALIASMIAIETKVIKTKN